MSSCELPSAKKRDEKLCAMLKDTKVMAVVGLSPKPHRDSNIVANYFKDKRLSFLFLFKRGAKTTYSYILSRR